MAEAAPQGTEGVAAVPTPYTAERVLSVARGLIRDPKAWLPGPHLAVAEGGTWASWGSPRAVAWSGLGALHRALSWPDGLDGQRREWAEVESVYDACKGYLDYAAGKLFPSAGGFTRVSETAGHAAILAVLTLAATFAKRDQEKAAGHG